MPSNQILDNLNNLNKRFKALFEDKYDKKYFVVVPVNQKSEGDSVSDVLAYFTIKNSNLSICNDITSAEKLSEIKNIILTDYEQFSLEIIEYYERVCASLDEQTGKSISIIAKTFKSRKKKLDAAFKRFTVQDHWGITQLCSEFESILVKFLSDLIENTIRPISTGLKEHSVYQDVLSMFNAYLAKLGVYTSRYEVGHKLTDDDWHMLSPVDSDDCETSDESLKDVIKNIRSYPYFIGDNTLILEGDVILWRVS
ncbi:MAG: hypothetical protein COA47_13595 [Robiginitomaculum sp.]|nr:MAG: hypothetical protein COA47_13595 [Robiginitomaculum sp.]